ncbi:hypothetical protein [Polynucleobacter antarcticus]|nr:hypothetical protein [Polynucleobacter antarcticus]
MPFIDTQDIMFMQSVLMKQFGGSAGLRDQSGLNAALIRPHTTRI